MSTTPPTYSPRAPTPMMARTLVMGRATPAGTRRFGKRHADRLPDGFYRELDGLTVGALGLGTYLGAPDDADDERAVNLGAGGRLSES